MLSLLSERVEFSLDHLTLETSYVKLLRPYGRIEIAPDKTTNLSGLMVAAKSGKVQGESTAEEQPLAITLGGFEIDNASLDFSDRSLPLPFAATIHSMNGTISTLSSATAEPAKIRLEGQVAEYGLARVSGSINPWSFDTYSDIRVIFRNLETARLSPYTIEFAGYEIAGGQIDLGLNYHIRQGKMLVTNKIVSRQLQLEAKIDTPGGVSFCHCAWQSPC